MHRPKLLTIAKDASIDVNLKATFLCCQAVCRIMRERR